MVSHPFSASDSALLLIDHQVGTMQLIKNMPRDVAVRNTIAMAKAAKILNMPVVLTSSQEERVQGPLIPQLREILPEAFDRRIKRAGTLTIGRYSHTRRDDLAAALKELPDTSTVVSRPSTSGLFAGSQTSLEAPEDHQHQHQHNVTKTGREPASGYEGVRQPSKDKARTKTLYFKDFCEPMRTDATLFVNAEGRTRTADLRVMNPAL